MRTPAPTAALISVLSAFFFAPVCALGQTWFAPVPAGDPEPSTGTSYSTVTALSRGGTPGPRVAGVVSSAAPAGFAGYSFVRGGLREAMGAYPGNSTFAATPQGLSDDARWILTVSSTAMDLSDGSGGGLPVLGTDRLCLYDRNAGTYVNRFVSPNNASARGGVIAGDASAVLGVAPGRTLGSTRSQTFKALRAASPAPGSVTDVSDIAWLDMPDARNTGVASGLSADARVGVGYANNGTLSTNLAWVCEYSGLPAVGGGGVRGTITTRRLPLLSGYAQATALGVSADGRVIVGYAGVSGAATRAVYWTRPARGWQNVLTSDSDYASLVTSPGTGGLSGASASRFVGASADGSTLLGYSLFPSADPVNNPEMIVRTFIWTAARGYVDAGALLQTDGVLPAGYTLGTPVGLSSDGTVFAGACTSAQGVSLGYIARLASLTPTPPGCNKADITDGAGTGGADGALTGSDVVVFFQQFFKACTPGQIPCGKSDITDGAGTGGADGALTASDVVVFFQQFFSPCTSPG